MVENIWQDKHLICIALLVMWEAALNLFHLQNYRSTFLEESFSILAGSRRKLDSFALTFSSAGDKLGDLNLRGRNPSQKPELPPIKFATLLLFMKCQERFRANFVTLIEGNHVTERK